MYQESSDKSQRDYSVHGHDNHLVGDKCPVTGAICHICGKKGHFSAYCFTKPLHAVSIDNTEEKTSSFLGTMTDECSE